MNKTRSYLVQQLLHYGDEFTQHISKNRIISYTIQDFGLGSEKLEPNVYILFDVNGNKKYGNYINIHKGRYTFQTSLLYYQKHSSYVNDYCYDSNKIGHLHVIVLKLPFPDKFDLFVNGEYSKMYSQNELDKWFIKDFEKTIVEKGKKRTFKEMNDQYQVLSHDPDYFPIFKDIVFNEFGTILNDDDIHMEYDFKPKLNKEILRYDKHKL